MKLELNNRRMKLERNNKRKSRKYSNTWRLNKTLFHDQGYQRKCEEIINFLEFNEIENTTYQNVWDTAKALLK
jgi:hypothetical protein